MKGSIFYKLRSGKNQKWLYYTVNFLRLMVPKPLIRMGLKRKLAQLSTRSDRAYIEKRVNYYNKLSWLTELPAQATPLSEHKMGNKQKVYFFDTNQYTRWFSPSYHWGFCPGDVTFVPTYPSVVKSRPLTDDNANSVLLNLNKVRHFIFVDDKKSFVNKMNLAIFRGKVNAKPSRIRFMEMYFNHHLCDLGSVSRPSTSIPSQWRTAKKTIVQHLDYKFILALEGNDVASNLKWIMSSNSIAVMPQPTCETWFMEGTLVPNRHYIEIKADFSDVEERLNHYIAHPSECQQIIEHAHAYVEQFKNKKRETLIALLVLDKYFKMTGQSTPNPQKIQ